MGCAAWEFLIGMFHSGAFAWDLPHRSVRLEYLAWKLSFGMFISLRNFSLGSSNLRTFAMELWFGNLCLGSCTLYLSFEAFAWGLSSDKFRLGYVALELSFEILRVATFTCDLSLCVVSLATVVGELSFGKL